MFYEPAADKQIIRWAGQSHAMNVQALKRPQEGCCVEGNKALAKCQHYSCWMTITGCTFKSIHSL